MKFVVLIVTSHSAVERSEEVVNCFVIFPFGFCCCAEGARVGCIRRLSREFQ